MLTRQLVDGLAGSSLSAPVPLDTAGVTQRDLTKLAGIYRDTRTNTTRRLDARDGQLFAGTTALRTLRDGSIGGGATRLRFMTAPDGSLREFLQPTADGDSVRFVFIQKDIWIPTSAELAAFAGRYRNEEIGVTFTVTVKGSQLEISPRGGYVEGANPIVKDGFTGLGGNVWFVRDARGRVTAMHFGSARVWDFVATKLP